jgi:PAS domain S-box-containing protein
MTIFEFVIFFGLNSLSPTNYLIPGILFFVAGLCSSLVVFVLYKIIRQRQRHKAIQSVSHNLLDESDQLNILINNLPDCVYFKDIDSKYILANNNFSRKLKANRPEDLYGKTDNDLYDSDVSAKYLEDDRKILNGELPLLRYKHSNSNGMGEQFSLTTKIPIKNKKGKIIGLMGTCSDITEQELIEREIEKQHQILEKERNLLRALMDNMPDTIYIKDKDCKFLDGNPEQIKVTKAKTYKNLIGKTDFDFYPKDIAELYYKDDKHVLETGESVINKEEIGFDQDGNIRVKSTTKVPIRDQKGNIIGLVGIGRDITRQKETEEKLKEQAQSLQEINVLLEERQEEINQQADELSSQNKILENERNLLRTIIDAIPDFIYIKDKESRFITANKKTLDIMKAKGLSDLEGKTDFDFYAKEIAQIFYDVEQAVVKKGKAIINNEEIGFDKDGNERVISTTKVPYFDSDGNIIGIVGVGRDITEMKESHKKLQEQARILKENNLLLEERQEEIQKQSESLAEQNSTLEKERNLLRTLIDNMPDYIYIKDRESRFLTVNKRLLIVMHKNSLDEIVGKTDYETAVTKESAEIYYKDDQELIKSGKPIINKEEIGFDENDRERVISTSKVPFYDADGNIAGIVGIGRDITKQKNAEKQLREQAQNLQEVNMILEERQEKIQLQSEELNKQAQHLQKINLQLEQLNATKNKFFSIIAHDLKNPFQAILGFSELLMRNGDDFEEVQKLELISMIKSSSESAFNLLENLLQWARTQTDTIKYNPQIIDLSDLIEQNIDLTKASAENKSITIDYDMSCDPTVYADSNMINLVIRNLLSNAIKFTRDEGKIMIKCFEKKPDELAVSITDTGIGISGEDLDKLFRIDEYFSTTGTSGEGGTGLGLIICKEFVEKNKGKIDIDSEPGVGTTFTFTLPVKVKK